MNVGGLLRAVRHILSAYLLKLKQYQTKETQRLEAQAYGDVVYRQSGFAVETFPSSTLHSHLQVHVHVQLSMHVHVHLSEAHRTDGHSNIQANEECVEMYNFINAERMNESEYIGKIRLVPLASQALKLILT